MSDPSSSEWSQALERLPHGAEFRFVDEVVDLEPGRSGVGRYTVKESAHFLKGHFPGRPLMPGVIMVEALAQMGGVVLQSDPEIPPLADLRLTAMRQVKILGTAVPGEVLELRVTVAGRLGPLIQIEGEVRSGERSLVRAQLTMSGQPA